MAKGYVTYKLKVKNNIQVKDNIQKWLADNKLKKKIRIMKFIIKITQILQEEKESVCLIQLTMIL